MSESLFLFVLTRMHMHEHADNAINIPAVSHYYQLIYRWQQRTKKCQNVRNAGLQMFYGGRKLIQHICWSLRTHTLSFGEKY